MAEAPWRQAVVQPGVTNKNRSDFADHRPEPPPCVQNAMLTKDKKPFTYTPGGIDLSEIRSPRMARRLERNAMSEGVSPTPQAPHGQQRTGPLPPSALAAMQPQLPVQVFPPGKIPQPPHCSPAPPPPPPPPMQELAVLPLDSLKRPDMTKIIPDNPMVLLRKTQGPVVKQDPILNKQSNLNNKSNNSGIPLRPTDTKVTNSQIGSIYIPPVNQNVAPETPPRDSPTGSIRAPPAFYKRQPSIQQTEPQSPPYAVQSKQVPTFDTVPQALESPKATLSKAPTPWLKQRNPSQDVPEWAVNDQKGINANDTEPIQVQKVKHQRPWTQKSLDAQESEGQIYRGEPQQWQQQQTEPQHFQQRQPELQSWQQRQVEQPLTQSKQHEPQQWQPKQPEPHEWQQPQPESQNWQEKKPEPQSWRQNQQSEIQSNHPTKSSQSPPVHMPQTGGVRKQISNRENPQEYYPNEKVEVVIVNDPPHIFQHPGQTQRVQRQQPPPQNQSVRIIPVQIERTTSNGHSNNDPRSLNRQQSWNSGPTQSNTFKVLQKITHTDGDDDEDNEVVMEHLPKTPQNFPQQSVQRGTLNHGDQELMNKFKQVPQVEQHNNRGPKVRTIPIQIEGDGPVRTIVPPSEQTVAEPKKYMGSAIPSRSFKILQAMTAPEECAKVERTCEKNENYPNDSTMCPQWGHHPNYPVPPSPFPYYYNPYWNCYNPYGPNITPNSDEDTDIEGESNANVKKNCNATPAPSFYYWSYNNNNNNNDDGILKNVRNTPTPIPFWPYYPPNFYGNNIQDGNLPDRSSTPYPPWNPYCYYYGAPSPLPHMYPPVYSPYPFNPPPQSDTDDNSGYSSTDEMACYGARFKTMPPFSYVATKSNALEPPSLQQKMLEEIKETAMKLEESRRKRQNAEDQIQAVADDESDLDAEMSGYEVRSGLNNLCSIPSVSNIHIYDEDESSDQAEDSESSTTEEIDDSLATVDETIPHQLSVIFEESERTESIARYAREGSIDSATTEGTNTLENTSG